MVRRGLFSTFCVLALVFSFAASQEASTDQSVRAPEAAKDPASPPNVDQCSAQVQALERASKQQADLEQEKNKLSTALAAAQSQVRVPER